VYQGQLVRLRAMEPADAERLFGWINDPEVRDHLKARYPFSMRQEHDWIDAHARVSYGNAAFAVETIAESRHIGGVDIRTTEPENRCGELGLMIGDTSAWGQGFGTDTVRTACMLGFDEMNLHRIELWVEEPNARARHVYEKIGFVQEGVARQQFFKRGGYVDMVLMGLLREELHRTD
jgi:RimJ/RimL family protein N-acetyltransferase